MSEETQVTHYLCIGCPLGCRLEVEAEEDTGDIVEVRGFSCKRGEKYAMQEYTEPRRMVTTTVAIQNGIWGRLPVKTTEAIPKEKVMDLCHQLRQVTLEAPVEMGDVVLPNVFNTGIDVVASRSMPQASGFAIPKGNSIQN